jgi:hypothetical protein
LQQDWQFPRGKVVRIRRVQWLADDHLSEPGQPPSLPVDLSLISTSLQGGSCAGDFLTQRLVIEIIHGVDGNPRDFSFVGFNAATHAIRGRNGASQMF